MLASSNVCTNLFVDLRAFRDLHPGGSVDCKSTLSETAVFQFQANSGSLGQRYSNYSFVITSYLGSFTYDCLILEICLLMILSWLIIACIVRKSICFVPMQWIGVGLD